MKFALEGKERSLAQLALDLLEKELNSLFARMDAVTLNTMQVADWIARIAQARTAFDGTMTDGVELNTACRTILETALSFFYAKCQKIKESQEKLTIEPDDTMERMAAIEWLRDTIRGVERLPL